MLFSGDLQLSGDRLRHRIPYHRDQGFRKSEGIAIGAASLYDWENLIMSAKYTIGLDYGTNSVRALVVNVANGAEVASAVWAYEHGTEGVMLARDPNVARQHPADYVRGAEETLRECLVLAAKADKKFAPERVIGIGVDTTGSTPLPVDASGLPLAFHKKFANNPAAMAWLWKDHTSIKEAGEITALAKKMRPQYLAKCGGTYSSEWFFSKILHCLRTAPDVFKAAHSWMEQSDFVPAMLTGTLDPDKFTAGVCAAGHKGMYSATWGGYPDKKFLAKLDPEMGALRDRLTKRVLAVDTAVGGLTADWAAKTGLPAGIPVTVGAIDAHTGAIGAGVKPGTLVKIIGTSTCDISVGENTAEAGGHPGRLRHRGRQRVAGLLRHGGRTIRRRRHLQLVGELHRAGGSKGGSHEDPDRGALELKPGESGLLALDWNNGNRTVLVDQQLTGLLLGQTLYTTPAEIYRALIEATASAR